MLKKILFSILLGYAGLANAQGFLNDANGRPVIDKGGSFVADGSPFLYDEYYPAELTFENGKVYKDVKTKIDLVDNELIYKDDNGNEYTVSAPVKSIKLLKPGSSGIILESPGKAVNATRSPVFQVLLDNKVRLLKQISITYTEARKYGEGGMTRTYKKTESYYAALPGQAPQKFEKNKASVAAVFGNKQTEILNFIDQNKLKCKSEEDFIKIFEYYSTLS